MLSHIDFDTDHTHTDAAVELPSAIESIGVSHDGGRLTITVNGVELYKTTSGTRDCSILIFSPERT